MARAQILVVDDEETIRTTMSDIITIKGYEVATAESGETAVQMCTENRYDVILMDVRMPGIDGVEAFRQIRVHQPDVRMIIMTAYSTQELEQVALDEGAIAFLPKPLDIQKVLEVIGEAVKKASILFVEEQGTLAAALAPMLEAKGYSVQSVTSPVNALELARQTAFTVVFIDLEMETMGGLELYLALRKINPTSVAVMLSKMHMELEKIPVTVMPKPVDPEVVLALLEQLTRP